MSMPPGPNSAFLISTTVVKLRKNYEQITSSSMIALLPKYVLLNLLKEWMLLVEIGKLDSALCSNESRPIFKLHLENCELNFNHEHLNSNEVSLLSWIVSRNLTIIISSLFLKEESNKQPGIVDLLKNHKFNCLKHLTITCGPGYKSLEEIIARAVNLENLTIVGASTIDLNTLQPMLNVCSQNLKILTLSKVDITEWTPENFHSFAGMLSNVVEFNLMKHFAETDSIKHLLRELFNKNSSLLKVIVGNYHLNITTINAFLADVLRDRPSFKAEELRFSYVTKSGGPMSVTWEKQKSECGTKYTNAITATNKEPFKELYLLKDEPTFKTLVLEKYKGLEKIYLRDVRQITSLQMKQCSFKYSNSRWFLGCGQLLQLHIEDTRSSAHAVYRVNVRNGNDNAFSVLQKLTIVDNSFQNAENWLDAIVFNATEALKQVVISVPESEMHKKVNDEVSSRLAMLGPTVTYMVRK